MQAPMATIYVRNVPQKVADQLAALAKRRGISTNALLVQELTDLARTARNADLLADLPSFDIDADEIAELIREGREERWSS